MFDGIEFRGFSHQTVETLAEFAGVPVWNGLTDEYHPTQILADMLTMIEHTDKPLNEIAYCYLGDARNNMGNSLMIAGCLMGMDVRIGAPRDLWPDASLIEFARGLEAQNKGRLTLTEDPVEAVQGVQFIHTDVWVSMGEPESVWEERVKLLKPYQVNARAMELTGNSGVKFLHCLPAFHNRDTEVGEEMYQKFDLEFVIHGKDTDWTGGGWIRSSVSGLHR